ncbi:AGRF5 protein, partial [Chloroceryle aenea]|nr:AGRF5 protein [Chloroceryle aenea]
MPSSSTTGLHCLFLLVTACCQTSQDSNFDPFMQYVIDSVLGEESLQSEMQRQKRNMITFDLPPLEYTVDIEVSLTDSSVLEPIKEYFKNLSLPVSTNISNVEMTVSSINVTTVCLSHGENSSCCSCENGYAWPSEVCSGLVTCPSVSLAPDLPCSYMKEMPFYGPYCKPQTEDSCDMQEPVVMNMFVRLDISFQDDLKNSSSELHKKYKADLEKAFNASYRCLPGFVSATVTGFSPGSVFVNYELKVGAATVDQIGNSNRYVQQFLDKWYQLNQSTFTEEKINQTTFTVYPEDISEGDTVILVCEINSTFENVTWYHSNDIISSRPRYSMKNNVSINTSTATLKIINIAMQDSGSYTCTFTKSNQFHTVIYKATKTVTVSPFYVIPNLSEITVTCNSPEIQTNGLLLSCCIDRHLPSLTGDWKVNGSNYITGVSSFTDNCTEYKLNINESLCPPEMSGAVATYTCNLWTTYGAKCSQNITVMYLWTDHVTISSSVNSSVSEGYSFNVTCKSDMNNYDRISWKIQSGNNTKSVECDTCIENRKSPAMSVLRVKKATQEWNGTYICTFSQKQVEKSANVTIKVVPLPLKQNIVIDPIDAFISSKEEQALECCISNNTTENYTVTFMIQEKPYGVGKKVKGDLLCYMHNYTYNETECKNKELKAYCKFVNHIGQETKSKNITLHVIPAEEASCSGSLGTGREGDILIKPCRDSNKLTGFTQGNLIYNCTGKVWKLEKNNCLSVEINNLLNSAQSLVDSPEAKTKLPSFLKELNQQTEKEKNTNISSANLAAIVTILHTISSVPADAEEPIIQNFLSTVDIIVANSTLQAWKGLNKERINQSSLLLRSVEDFSLHLQPVNNTIPSVSVNTLQLQGIVVTGNSSTNYNKTFNSTGNLGVKVFIGESDIQTLRENSTIVSVMYSNLGCILPENESESINGVVISTTMSSNRSQTFNVNMTFAKRNLSLKTHQCVFWNFTLNDGGGWDTSGCTPTEAEDSVNCSCNHLTSFSILMSHDVSSEFSFEDYITYIGLAISILSLAACIIIESLVWKYVTNNTTSYMRHVCILNIAISLLIADIWFIVTAYIADRGIQKTESICVVATFFIHLFYLCVFFWMLSLGLILFYRLVFIFHNTSKTAQKAVAFCLGYGCPFVIAVITIAVTLPRKSYTRNDVCWLTWEGSKPLLAFVIPALMIVAMNLFITAIVIIKILRPTVGDRSNRQERNSLFQIVKSVAILTPLLGLTWGFGLATVITKRQQAFHILFVLLNAFQGFLILVFGTLWDKKIQEALLKRHSVSKWSSQQSKSTSLILVTPMLAMSYPFSRTFNNLCGKTGKYRVSSSEPSSSSCENTSKSYSLLN